MIHVLIFIALILVVLLITTRIIKRNYQIKEGHGLYKHVNRFHIWLEIIIIILMVVLFFLLTFVFDHRLKAHYFLGGIAILFAFRGIMEWKNIKETKQYLLTFLNSSLLLILFIGITLFTLPKEISYTQTAFMFSEDGVIHETVDIEINGQLNRNILSGDYFTGYLNFLDQEYLVIRYGRNRGEVISDSLINNRFFYTIIESNSNTRGEVWASRGFQSFAGKINEQNPLFIAAPARTLEEAEDLYKKLFSDH